MCGLDKRLLHTAQYLPVFVSGFRLEVTEVSIRFRGAAYGSHPGQPNSIKMISNL